MGFYVNKNKKNLKKVNISKNVPFLSAAFDGNRKSFFCMKIDVSKNVLFHILR